MQEDVVYRFFPDNIYSLSALSNNYLWFSDIADFNDPFETSLKDMMYYQESTEMDDSFFIRVFKNSPVLKDKSPAEKERHLAERFLTNKKQFKHEFLKMLKDSHEKTLDFFMEKKWCCFSYETELFGSPLHRRLMWSHYANGLRGFVMEFNQSALKESLDTLNEGDVISSVMVYDQLERMNFFELHSEQFNSLGKLISLKSSEWNYETEVRLGADISKMFYSPSTINRVIIGEKIPEETKKMLLCILKGHSNFSSIPIFEARIDVTNFNINIFELII